MFDQFRTDATPTSRSAGAVLTATLGLAAASWVVAVRLMNGMDMGVATRLGSCAFFVAPAGAVAIAAGATSSFASEFGG